jgi:hypothetical protein
MESFKPWKLENRVGMDETGARLTIEVGILCAVAETLSFPQ